MFDKDKDKKEKLEELINLANTPEEELEKMNFRDKQKVYKAKNKLCRKSWDSSKGTYRRNNEWKTMKPMKIK